MHNKCDKLVIFSFELLGEVYDYLHMLWSDYACGSAMRLKQQIRQYGRLVMERNSVAQVYCQQQQNIYYIVYTSYFHHESTIISQDSFYELPQDIAGNDPACMTWMI